MKYPVALHTDDGVNFGVTVPDLPGCYSAGAGEDEALDNAKEAILAHLEFLAEGGDPIPAARSITSHRANPDFSDAVWAVVDVDVTPFLGKAEKINITVPRLLLHQIDEYVKAHKSESRSRSGFLSQAAMRVLNRSDEKDKEGAA
ncbi:MAG: type II toxin-antitoxin system HicB family antitoxin [Oleiphilaceae bacterium]|nr:type II toxin-antitoxin system HicB family antitoxin [Oleiphilaceae bacterium]